MDIAPEHLGFPDEEVMSCDQGLTENHFYRDLRWVEVEDYYRWAGQADEILAAGEFDEDEPPFEDNEVWLLNLDPWIAPVVGALAAIGCCPVTSCSGGPDHYEQHPLVLVWCEQEHLNRILKAAHQIEGVQVEGVSTPGVLIYTFLGPELLREFAEKLVRTGEGEPAPSHPGT